MSTLLLCCATNLPSLNSRDLSAKAATSLLCVTIKKATSFSLCNFLNKPRTSLLVIGSKAPVGSSAKINFGFVIKALAIATLCCSPPDNSSGIPLALSSIFKKFKRSLAFS